MYRDRDIAINQCHTSLHLQSELIFYSIPKWTLEIYKTRLAFIKAATLKLGHIHNLEPSTFRSMQTNISMYRKSFY